MGFRKVTPAGQEPELPCLCQDEAGPRWTFAHSGSRTPSAGPGPPGQRPQHWQLWCLTIPTLSRWAFSQGV